jgi:hypothetical protein
MAMLVGGSLPDEKLQKKRSNAVSPRSLQSRL